MSATKAKQASSQPDSEPLERLLTIEEVAKAFTMSVRNVRRLWSMKKFPCPLRIGDGLRWRPSDLRDWQNKQIAASPRPPRYRRKRTS